MTEYRITWAPDVPENAAVMADPDRDPGEMRRGKVHTPSILIAMRIAARKSREAIDYSACVERGEFHGETFVEEEWKEFYNGEPRSGWVRCFEE